MLSKIGEVAVFLAVTTMFVAPYIRLFKVKSSAPYEPDKKIEYTNNLLEFTKEFIAEQCAMQFSTWIANHTLENSTKAQFTSYMSEIINKIKSSINTQNISFENTIITSEYFDEYIIDTSIIFLKNLLDKEYKKLEEEHL